MINKRVGLGAILSMTIALAVGISPTYATTSRLPNVVIGYEEFPDPEAVTAVEGYFSKYMHANVTLKSFASGPAALTAMASGSINFMTDIGNPPVGTAIAHGVPLKVVWAQEQITTGEGLVVKKSSGITNLHALVGKSVALAQGSSSDLALSSALKAAHISQNSVKVLNMTPSGMVAAWKSNQIVAAFTWDPALNQMIHAGGHVVTFDSKQPSPIFNLSVVNENWANSHKSLVTGFIQAMSAGVNFYDSHRSKALENMAKWNSITVASAKSQAGGFRFLSLKDQVGSHGLKMVIKSLSDTMTWEYSEGNISTVPSGIASDVDQSYVRSLLSKK